MGIVDCHCDVISRIWRENESILANRGQFDVCRARAAGVSLQFCALFTDGQGEATLRTILRQLDKFHEELARYPDDLYMVTSYRDIETNRDKSAIGCLLHLEGGEALGGEIEILRVLHRLGLRSIGLTWNKRNLLADGAMDDGSGGGLSNLGRAVVKLAQDLGMLVDLAHLSQRGFFHVIDLADKPVIVSHANARSLCDHPRNLSDEQLKALAGNGGLVGCTLVPEFVGTKSPGLSDFIDHLVYISDLIGTEYVALGSDFDGVDTPVLTDVSQYSLLEPALRARGFNHEEIDKILKENCLALLKRVLK